MSCLLWKYFSWKGNCSLGGWKLISSKSWIFSSFFEKWVINCSRVDSKRWILVKGKSPALLILPWSISIWRWGSLTTLQNRSLKPLSSWYRWINVSVRRILKIRNDSQSNFQLKWSSGQTKQERFHCHSFSLRLEGNFVGITNEIFLYFSSLQKPSFGEYWLSYRCHSLREDRLPHITSLP